MTIDTALRMVGASVGQMRVVDPGKRVMVGDVGVSGGAQVRFPAKHQEREAL